MCVDEVKELYESLAPVIKHFSFAFDRAMEMSGSTPLHCHGVDLKNVDRSPALVTTIYNSAHNAAIEMRCW